MSNALSTMTLRPKTILSYPILGRGGVVVSAYEETAREVEVQVLSIHDNGYRVVWPDSYSGVAFAVEPE